MARGLLKFDRFEDCIATFRQAAEIQPLDVPHQILLRAAELHLESSRAAASSREDTQRSPGEFSSTGIYDLLVHGPVFKKYSKMDILQALVNAYASPQTIVRHLSEATWPNSLSSEKVVHFYSDREERYKIIDVLHMLPAYRPSKKWALVISRRLEAKKVYTVAIEYLKTYGEPAKDDYDHNLLLGSLYDRLKDRENALHYLGRASSLRPMSASLADRLLRLEYDAVKKNPLRPRATFESVLKQKLETCQRSLKRDPKTPRLRHDLARVLFYAESYRDAERS
ncbi:hypothetical protein AJ87_24260 [Rhizobium yanglingense]|nr:hypothetical protein AJ87_24260 [Rhizobium yanglingense]